MAEPTGLRPHIQPIPLDRLLKDAPPVPISGLNLDSRRVEPGDLYLALPGTVRHGADFARAAVDRGAVAILTDADGARRAVDVGVPLVVVESPRAVMARLAADFHGRPAQRLQMFGITGTNGKTSTLFLLEAGLAAAGRTVGTVGTIGFRVAGRELPAERTTVTTPEAPDLQALLATMSQAGADAVAMEVSSHALALGRVDEITFDVAAFTHLGRDHLDFHHDLEEYFWAKASLFLNGRCRAAVVNIDDDAGRRLAELVRQEGRARLVTCSELAEADYRIASWTSDETGRSRVSLHTPGGGLDFTVGMVGRFNVLNAMTATAMIETAGLSLTAAASAFATAQVPGRMQRVDLGVGAPQVVVDFAHTPEAVRAALSALPGGRRVAVIGCGGDRDPIKRGPMGEIAAELAEVVVVTDDNPRSEEPAAIRAAILAGARQGASASGALVLDGGDRRSAIRTALERADPAGWIAILGKGHERGQNIGGVISPFDDVVVVREEWDELTGRREADA